MPLLRLTLPPSGRLGSRTVVLRLPEEVLPGVLAGGFWRLTLPELPLGGVWRLLPLAALALVGALAYIFVLGDVKRIVL